MPRTAPELAANLTVGFGGVTLKTPLICGSAEHTMAEAGVRTALAFLLKCWTERCFPLLRAGAQERWRLPHCAKPGRAPCAGPVGCLSVRITA